MLTASLAEARPSAGANANAAPASVRAGATDELGTLVAQKKKKKPKKTKGKGKGKGSESAAETPPAPGAPAATTPAAPAAAPAAPPAAAAPAAPAAGGDVLDLSDAAPASDAAVQELISGEKKEEPKKGKGGGGFDFGGGAPAGDDKSGAGAFDFGEVELDLGTMTTASAESERFEKALQMMSDEDYTQASLEFRYFLDDPKYADFVPEAQYQLAKALYKLGFLDSSLERFKQILEQGPAHRRYKKSVEWLFFISRKMADETPVLAELARFRNVTFPKAYRNEYRYLLSKYLFIQANRLEVQRVQELELARNKKRVEGFDFGAAAEAADSGAGSFDFSALNEDASFDFGGGGGGGSFDFGGGGAKEEKKPADKKDDAFDFGGGIEGGGFDFGGGGGGAPAPAPVADGPVREAAPTTAKEAIRQGLDFLTEVEPDSKFYPRAKYLEGLLHYLAGADQEAVNAFQEVVRVLNPRGGARLDPKLRETAFLSLARIHYGYKQFDRSAYYYDQIDRDSENWLTALFEASWAYYRRGDFEKALGNLLTLHSPFFEREYFPESQLVKAIIYFEACRYPETRTIVDDFIERFGQVMKEIEKIATSQDSPDKLYERIQALQAGASEGGGDDVTARLVSLALNDPEIRTARLVIEQVQEQLALWQQMPEQYRQSKVGQETREEIANAAIQRSKDAGEVTRKKFEREMYALKGLLAQALRVKLEVARAEREVIEAQQRGEKTYDEIVAAVPRVVVDDEHHYWPYEGEYWRDELGTYELDFSMCRPLSGAQSASR